MGYIWPALNVSYPQLHQIPPCSNLRVYSKPALPLIITNINTLIIKDKLINNASLIISGSEQAFY